MIASTVAKSNDDDGNTINYLGKPENINAGLGMVGSSNAIKEVRRMIQIAASSSIVVFLRGEPGTGKELAAKAIHQSSMNRNGYFSLINCPSIPETLFE